MKNKKTTTGKRKNPYIGDALILPEIKDLDELAYQHSDIKPLKNNAHDVSRYTHNLLPREASIKLGLVNDVYTDTVSKVESISGSNNSFGPATVIFGPQKSTLTLTSNFNSSDDHRGIYVISDPHNIGTLTIATPCITLIGKIQVARCVIPRFFLEAQADYPNFKIIHLDDNDQPIICDDETSSKDCKFIGEDGKNYIITHLDANTVVILDENGEMASQSTYEYNHFYKGYNIPFNCFDFHGSFELGDIRINNLQANLLVIGESDSRNDSYPIIG